MPMTAFIITSLKKRLQLRRETKKQRRWRRRITYFLAGALIALIVLPCLTLSGYALTYRGRVYPGVSVAGVPAGRMNQESMNQALTARVAEYKNKWPQRFTYGQYEWLIPYPSGTEAYDIPTTARQAYAMGRQGKLIRRILTWRHLWQIPQDIPIAITVPGGWFTDLSASISGTLTKELVPPSITILETGKTQDGSRVVIERGEAGRAFDRRGFEEQTARRLAALAPLTIEGMVHDQPVTVTDADIQSAKARAEKMLDQQMTIQATAEPDTQTWQLKGEDLVAFIKVTGGYDREKLTEYLNEVAILVNRSPQDAKFQFDPESQKVMEFLPAKDGLTVEIEKSADAIQNALRQIESGTAGEKVLLAVKAIPPAVSLENVNDLGIKKLLGRGESTYFHSIPTRVHNVNLAASRINGTLIKPGESFSFNQAVGEVSGATGYQQAYIIKSGRTELGDGGGVCQVSTTTFRAALSSGLEITDRRAHAYRVGYYEQDQKAGIDATVYAPNPDLKFLNDTPAYILIQTTNDVENRHLIVDIYGTSDGRTSEILNHTVCCVSPPLPDVFVDDPTLQTGQVKQIDWKAAGAKAKFDYRVMRNNEVIFEKTFASNYKPWASVFLRGTKN